MKKMTAIVFVALVIGLISGHSCGMRAGYYDKLIKDNERMAIEIGGINQVLLTAGMVIENTVEELEQCQARLRHKGSI